jgi:hypothetical protein
VPKAPAPSPVEQARQAALRGEPGVVRQLLENKVRSGHGTHEEIRLVREACKVQQDRACTEDIKARYENK